MRIKIAGGCGEHGRNCFYVEMPTCVFLVDCGLMAGEADGGYPDLTEKEISKINYIFLTHSHADHTGALPWIIEKGFAGQIVASAETLQQLPFCLENTLTLEQFQMQDHPVCMKYGYSGHCVGSVWYELQCDEKVLFFSGDYVEKNLVHRIDLIRNRRADIAVIDCAYGYDRTTFRCCCTQLTRYIRQNRKEGQSILLPVPKFGRGLELYYLLKRAFPKWSFSADMHFLKQFIEVQKSPWLRKSIKLEGDVSLYSEEHRTDIVFVSDPQLKSKDAQLIASQVLKHGYGIMTGTVEAGTFSEALIDKGKMKMFRFPVHLNYSQFKKVASENSFKEIIMYHSKEIDCNKEFLR